ncbi:AT-rich interactive domain-containing protein 5B-like [Battus philenor]|uniref:AT-rich interactive domain-containing protein 5B-like n=1 Tax=Battus philenor TaxID=42288 RepID=UPI0035CEEE77
MEKPSYKLVGAPCGQHGQYTFYKAIRLTGKRERIVAIGDFFFVRIWQDSELVSIGELQLLWTDRVSDQTLVSLRLYFLPENTPDGRGQHGEDEVLAINDKVVLRAEDLLSWVCEGSGWRWGLRAVWRGACAPPADPRRTSPLHHTKLDFSDVEREKNAMTVDAESPGVMVFSYPRYCRYRALLARLEGIQADWLRDSLVAALGGYAAPTKNTRILYCKETFEYPELEGHEFVCNHLAPRLKGRPRGRRRRQRSRSASRSDSDEPQPCPRTPRRLSLRNGGPERQSEEEVEDGTEDGAEGKSKEEREFLHELRKFYRARNESFKSLKHVALRGLYAGVAARGGYEAVCRARLWRALSPDQPARARRHYERFLLPFENHERKNGSKIFNKLANGRLAEPKTIDTIEVQDSPLRELDGPRELPAKRLRTPSPRPDKETGELVKPEELDVTNKPAEQLNREFLDSLPKEEKQLKITVKPVEQLIDGQPPETDTPINELTKLSLANADTTLMQQLATGERKTLNGHLGIPATNPHPTHPTHPTHPVPPGQPDQRSARPAGRSSLRAVRVKPTRPLATASAPSLPPPRTDSAAGSPQPAALNNFGIHHPPPTTTATTTTTTTGAHSDDEIVEVPYKPKTPEIIDLDEYPESPQSVKKKKLDILKERGLEVTAVPPTWPLQPVLANPITPLISPAPIILNPAVQHQIMTQAQLFQMYNIIPPSVPNGVQPPKVIQATSIFGSSGPEKTVYGNPKDPFMPPPHVVLGAPVRAPRCAPTATPPRDALDLTCKPHATTHAPAHLPPHRPAVEIVRVPPTLPAPSHPQPHNLSKNYTLLDGKAVVGSNLEITLVNPKPQTPPKRPPQKRSSNGKFVSVKTPTPPKDYRPYPPASPSGHKKNPIVVPHYQIPRDDGSPGKDPSIPSVKPQNSLAQMMEMQKSVPSMTPFMDPVYMSALYSSLGQLDQRQLAAYRDLVADQFRGYSGLLTNTTPTTKN